VLREVGGAGATVEGGEGREAGEGGVMTTEAKHRVAVAI
jgi:hypothetical protein